MIWRRWGRITADSYNIYLDRPAKIPVAVDAYWPGLSSRSAPRDVTIRAAKLALAAGLFKRSFRCGDFL